MRKKDDGTYSLFQSDEDEASYYKWEKENKILIALVKKIPREELELTWLRIAWQSFREATLLQNMFGLVDNLKAIIAMKESAIKTARMSVMLEHLDAIQEKNSRKLGGDIRGMLQTAEKERKYSEIQGKEKELTSTVKPHRLNAKIAEGLNLPYDYVRKARAIIKKSG